MADHTVPRRPCMYCRLSHAPDGSLEKVERQEADGRAMAARLGWPEFCCVYVDNSRSAWQRNRKRPDWDRMLLTLDPGTGQLIAHDPKASHHHDGIMVYHGDRLIRQPYDLELLLNLAASRQFPLASVSGVRDLSSADDRFVLRIEAAQACRESDNVSRRVIRGNNALAAKGEPSPGGKRPFGFELDRKTRRESECKIIVQAVDKLFAGQSKAGVVRWLNTVSTTTQGGLWSVRTMNSMLRSPRMAGLIERNGTLYEAVWDAVIPVDRWVALNALLDTAPGNGSHVFVGVARKHMLSGVAECGLCHGLVKTKPTTGKRAAKDREGGRIYFCPYCQKVARNIRKLDAYVDGHVLDLLNSGALLAELDMAAGEGTSVVAAEIAELEQRKAHAATQLENLADLPGVDPALLARSLASFDTKMRTLRSKLATSAGTQLVASKVGISREGWAAEPVDVRSTVVRTLYQVVINRAKPMGPGFDTASIDMLRRPLSAAGGPG